MDREFNISFKLSDIFKLLVMSPVLAVLVFWVLDWPWSSNNAPAWVQAIGSIGAIGVAIWVSTAQATNARLERERREYHYMFKAHKVASFTNTTVKLAVLSLEADPTDLNALRIYHEQLQHSCADAAQFSYASMVDLDFADAWSLHRRVAEMVSREMGKQLAAESGSTVLEGLSALADESAAQVEKIRIALEEHSKKVGSGVWEHHHT